MSTCSVQPSEGMQRNSGDIWAAPIVVQNIDPAAVSANPTFNLAAAFVSEMFRACLVGLQRPPSSDARRKMELGRVGRTTCHPEAPWGLLATRQLVGAPRNRCTLALSNRPKSATEASASGLRFGSQPTPRG